VLGRGLEEAGEDICEEVAGEDGIPMVRQVLGLCLEEGHGEDQGVGGQLAAAEHGQQGAAIVTQTVPQPAGDGGILLRHVLPLD
jgi:hypothetical protein